ncbi:metallophosphoesterase family protein [Haloferula helveola]
MFHPFRVLSFLSLTLSLDASVHGPFVQWSTAPESEASVRWVETSGGSGSWTLGKSGFGYGDADDATVIREMEGRFAEVYVRRKIAVPGDLPEKAELVLLARYDDAFTLAIDGREAVRKNVRVVDGREQVIQKHEANKWEEISLGKVEAGERIFSAVGFNDGLQSSDFTLDLKVVARWDGGEREIVGEGAEWEYLAGAKPTAGWRRQVGVEKKEDSDELPELRVRVKGETDWKLVEVERVPFAKSAHTVASAELTGLPSGTDIELRLGDRDVVFRTAPSKAETLRFVTGGDMFHSRGLLDAMNARAGAEDPMFALLGGDLAYTNNQNVGRWFEWIDSWVENARTPDGRQVPMVVAIGNHEITGAGYRPNDAPGPEAADEFFSLFRMQEAGEARQAIDFEAGLSLVLLDSGHAATLASQTDWLEARLKEREKVKHLFVCYHRPAWGCGTKEDAVGIQKLWCPLFEKYQVDAVFENDHHVHSRSAPMFDGKVDTERGVPYLGAGAWGTKVRSIPANLKKVRPWMESAYAKNHLYAVTLEEEGWMAVAKEADGEVFDRVERRWRR